MLVLRKTRVGGFDSVVTCMNSYREKTFNYVKPDDSLVYVLFRLIFQSKKFSLGGRKRSTINYLTYELHR